MKQKAPATSHQPATSQHASTNHTHTHTHTHTYTHTHTHDSHCLATARNSQLALVGFLLDILVGHY